MMLYKASFLVAGATSSRVVREEAVSAFSGNVAGRSVGALQMYAGYELMCAFLRCVA